MHVLHVMVSMFARLFVFSGVVSILSASFLGTAYMVVDLIDAFHK